jgi:hypothetical protein
VYRARLVAPGLTDVRYVSGDVISLGGSDQRMLDEPQAQNMYETCGQEFRSAGRSAATAGRSLARRA